MELQSSDFAGLLSELKNIIDDSRKRTVSQAQNELLLSYWQIGRRLSVDVLDNERAPYGKQIIKNIAKELTDTYGRSFEVRNLRRMMQFARIFPKWEIVSPVATQLSWTHFVEVLTLKKSDQRWYYLKASAEGNWGKRELRRQIERKAFERAEISELRSQHPDPSVRSAFKDPYLLDFLGLRVGYSEDDLESAILRDLENFILELGTGFTFIERQKRIILDGVDFYIDLLFYHRKLQRLVVIDLKLDRFRPTHKGQMELYLKWLNRYDRQPHEKAPIGMILCAEASREQVELLEMDKDGIMVAEYLTELPPKEELEQRLRQALIDARERLSRGKLNE